MIEILNRFVDLIGHPYVVALISLFIGCYLLRDIVRIIIYILDASRRADKYLGRREEENERISPR